MQHLFSVLIRYKMFVFNGKSERCFSGQNFTLPVFIVKHIPDPDRIVLCFQLCKGHRLCDESPAMRCGRIKVRLIDSKPVAVIRFENRLRIQIMSQTTEPTVKFSKYNQIHASESDIIKQLLKISTFDFPAGDSIVNVGSGQNHVFFGCNISFAGRELFINTVSLFRLSVCGDTYIYSNICYTHNISLLKNGYKKYTYAGVSVRAIILIVWKRIVASTDSCRVFTKSSWCANTGTIFIYL